MPRVRACGATARHQSEAPRSGSPKARAWSMPITVPSTSPVLGVLGDEDGQRPVVARGSRRSRVGTVHHAARRVDDVDRLGIAQRREPPDEEGLRPAVARRGRWRGRAGRCATGRGTAPAARREQDVRIADVEGDVAPVRPFGAQRLGEAARGCEGVGEDQPAPAAVDAGVARSARAPRSGSPARLRSRRQAGAGRHGAAARSGVGSVPLMPRSPAPGATSRAARPARARSRAAA